MAHVVPGEFTEGAGADGAERLLRGGELPTAVFAANDLVALGLIDRLEADGVRIPQDVSVVGYDNTFVAGLDHIMLTTVNQPRPRWAGRRCELLLERAAGVTSGRRGCTRRGSSCAPRPRRRGEGGGGGRRRGGRPGGGGGCRGSWSRSSRRRGAVFAVRATGALAPSSGGTGFAAGDGRVVTADHVVAGARAVRVGRRPARVVREHVQLDLAAVAVPGLRAPALRTASARAGAAVTVRVLRGRAVRTLRGRVLRTITVHVRPAPGARSVVRPGLELAVTVRRGDSGAPVLDADGRVVGVVFAQASDRDDLAYAVAAGALSAVLR